MDTYLGFLEASATSLGHWRVRTSSQPSQPYYTLQKVFYRSVKGATLFSHKANGFHGEFWRAQADPIGCGKKIPINKVKRKCSLSLSLLLSLSSFLSLFPSLPFNQEHSFLSVRGNSGRGMFPESDECVGNSNSIICNGREPCQTAIMYWYFREARKYCKISFT